MSISKKFMERVREEVEEVSVDRAYARVAAGAIILDVREPEEVAGGSPHEAVRLGRSFLEFRVEHEIPDRDREILVMCAGGSRSLLAGASLQQMGYRQVKSIRGGFNQWKTKGLPFEVPKVLGSRERERYQRHLIIPEVGEKGQARLLGSKVLLVGAGGLGSPTALYLAAAGVGTITIIDDDVVDRSNLQRQILHKDKNVGRLKVESAKSTLLELNPDISIEVIDQRLTSENVERLFTGQDVIADGTDNFATRYLVNDACVKLKIPNVHGSIFRFEGQVSVFWPSRSADAPCYRCLYPEPPPPEMAPSCAEAGVLGILPGVVGVMQAVETVKILLGIGQLLTGRLLVYDALASKFNELRLRKDPECPYCGVDVDQFPGYIDYQNFCQLNGKGVEHG